MSAQAHKFETFEKKLSLVVRSPWAKASSRGCLAEAMGHCDRKLSTIFSKNYFALFPKNRMAYGFDHK